MSTDRTRRQFRRHRCRSASQDPCAAVRWLRIPASFVLTSCRTARRAASGSIRDMFAGWSRFLPRSIPSIHRSCHNYPRAFVVRSEPAGIRHRPAESPSDRVAERERQMNGLLLRGRRRPSRSARMPHIGAWSGLEMTHMPARPPSRSTRRNSFNPVPGSAKNCNPS